jgi:hypothetical protein
MERYDTCSTIHTKELPNATTTIPSVCISTTVWSASPQGLTNGIGGALMMSLPDATIAQRNRTTEFDVIVVE